MPLDSITTCSPCYLDNISIIIPAYNSERYIGQCLDSILSQSHSRLEVVCVDDASTDNTLQVLEHYAAKDGRIKIVHHAQNYGISASRNDALDIVNGDWVMFVDSDDWISPETCSHALEAAKRHNADTVAWCYTREFEGRSLPKKFEENLQIWDDDVHALHRRMFGPYREELSRPDLLDAWGTIWGKLYNKKILGESPSIRFVDTRVVGTAEDVVFNIDYFSRAHKVVYIPEPWYHYRKDMKSYSNQHRDDLASKWDKLYDVMEERITTQQHGADVKEALQNRIALGVLGLGIIAMRSEGTLAQKYHCLKELLRRDRQHKALRQLDLSYFAPHWKLFYFTAKHQITPLFMAMQMAIGKIISK